MTESTLQTEMITGIILGQVCLWCALLLNSRRWSDSSSSVSLKSAMYPLLPGERSILTHECYPPISGLPWWPVREMRVPFLGWEDPLEEGMTSHSSILPWEIPWTEEPGGLQSMDTDTDSVTKQQQSHLCNKYT